MILSSTVELSVLMLMLAGFSSKFSNAGSIVFILVAYQPAQNGAINDVEVLLLWLTMLAFTKLSGFMLDKG